MQHRVYCRRHWLFYVCYFVYQFMCRFACRFEYRFEYRFDFSIDCHIAKYWSSFFDNCRSRKYWWYWWKQRFFEYTLINVIIENNYNIHSFLASIASTEKWRFVRFVRRFNINLIFYDSFTSFDIVSRFCFNKFVTKCIKITILKLKIEQLIDDFFFIDDLNATNIFDDIWKSKFNQNDSKINWI